MNQRMRPTMSDVITEAVAALNEKMDGGFDGTAKFDIEGEGAIIIDEGGARAHGHGAARKFHLLR